ncbi:phage antirepressor [Pseudomonas cavernicola]|uniref:Phage antirepressor n=1 Tax=Pseudomonas cavernicola TaxID=2320866 RepID=A0A418XET4_9PSED|nr:BRO family protein [Pseudomonas cavernicola]RJG10999.1 phage antirepressor [Pseudomonas cavernicola]
MHEAFTPLIFHRYNRPLRGLMIDNQPWFAARDFGLLMGHRHPERICRLADDDQIRTVRFAQAGGGEEMVEVISESAAYRALCRFTHPENRNLRRWLTHEVIPTLRDARNPDIQAPRRTLMNWGTQRVSLLEWQGKLWIPLNELPDFSQIDADRQQSARLGLLQRWLR